MPSDFWNSVFIVVHFPYAVAPAAALPDFSTPTTATQLPWPPLLFVVIAFSLPVWYDVRGVGAALRSSFAARVGLAGSLIAGPLFFPSRYQVNDHQCGL